MAASSSQAKGPASSLASGVIITPEKSQPEPVSGTEKALVRKEVVKGIVNISRHKEFYGHIIQQFEKVFVDTGHEIDTAAVGRYPGLRFLKLWLSFPFFRDILKHEDINQARTWLRGVLEHEVLHIVFGHLFMRLEDNTRAGVAQDCVINSILNPEDKKDILPGNYVHPAHYGFPLDKSTLWYYTHLRENDKFKKQCASGAFGAGGILSHIMRSHGAWKDVENDPVTQEFAKDIVRKSRDLCNKQYGKVPGRVIQQIEELLRRKKAVVPWNKVLRMFVASCAESVLDYTIKRVSRRYGTRPGTRKGDVLRLAVAIDTSGSISDAQLKLFWNEIRWIWKNGAQVWVYECDTHLSVRSPFRFKGRWDGKVHGRGGTSVEPPLAHAEGKYDALIYFTDFYAPKVSRKYRIPTLWILSTEMKKDEYPYPWGRHIKIEDGKARAA
jgi:predicted metal-dependent peptidase